MFSIRQWKEYNLEGENTWCNLVHPSPTLLPFLLSRLSGHLNPWMPWATEQPPDELSSLSVDQTQIHTRALWSLSNGHLYKLTRIPVDKHTVKSGRFQIFLIDPKIFKFSLQNNTYVIITCPWQTIYFSITGSNRVKLPVWLLLIHWRKDFFFFKQSLLPVLALRPKAVSTQLKTEASPCFPCACTESSPHPHSVPRISLYHPSLGRVQQEWAHGLASLKKMKQGW